jgi:hypothetical protein
MRHPQVSDHGVRWPDTDKKQGFATVGRHLYGMALALENHADRRPDDINVIDH